MAALEQEPLDVLRFEAGRARAKLVVKATDLAASQQLYFASPFIDKLLSMIVSVLPAPKYAYKRTPARDRRSDADCVLKPRGCWQSKREGSTLKNLCLA